MGTKLGHHLRTAALAAALCTFAGCYWTQPGYDAHHTGYHPHEHAITAANASTLDVDWSGPLGGPGIEIVRSRAGLVHALDGGGTITSVDPVTADLGWFGQVELGSTGLTTIVAAGDSILVPTYDPFTAPYGCLAHFDAADGTDLGCVPFEGPHPALVGGSGRVAFRAAVSGDRVVLTQHFDTSLGGQAAFLSSVHLGDPSGTWTEALAPVVPDFDASNPVVIGAEILVVANVQGAAPSLQRWPLACAADPCAPTSSTPLSVWFSPAISASADGALLAAVSDTEVEVVDLATGATAWTGSFGGGTALHPTAVATWAGDALLVPAYVPADGVDPDTTRVLRFAAAGCGAATCDAVWTAPIEGWATGQIAAAADIAVVGTTQHPAAVLPLDCADPCAPLHVLDGTTFQGPPIIIDGRIFTTGDLGAGDELIALQPNP